MTHLDTLLDADTRSQLHALGVDVVDAAFKLANTLPNIISVALNMNESREVLAARVANIAGAMGRAMPPALPADRDGWLAGRGSAAAPPAHGQAGAMGGAPTPGASIAPLLAKLPPEVPTLPAMPFRGPRLQRRSRSACSPPTSRHPAQCQQRACCQPLAPTLAASPQ